MTFRVIVLPLAERDLDDLSRWIESEAGAAIAERYDARIRAQIATLAHFPNRGTPRGRIRSRLRTLLFEQRLLIIYEVDDDDVIVRRIVSAVRDNQALLDG